ncbi:MAG TPA: MarR family transcriptional regulator [Burkholderiales bacterium]|nr:MarR family transcriptional regulator [Burkholderiales bacterium]
MTQLYDARLKPAGLLTAQFSLLRYLSNNHGVRTSDLADALLIDNSTLTRTLATLRSLGWIAQDAAEDRRERRWIVTREGSARLKLALPLWKKAQAELDAKIGAGDMRRLNRTVSEIAARIAAA